MQVVILCGGRGQRAYPLTEEVPKPMVAIGGRPILLHFMGLFADQGHTEFILSLGYRQQIIRDYFVRPPAGWRMESVDSGESADTGDRVHGCRHLSCQYGIVQADEAGQWAGASLERDGFFRSFDSLKGQLEFEDLLQSATPPWRRTPRVHP